VSNVPGVLFRRKPKGRKLQFMVGGPTLAQALTYIIPTRAMVFVWHGADGSHVEFCAVGP
jgi:hypothetical protein